MHAKSSFSHATGDGTLEDRSRAPRYEYDMGVASMVYWGKQLWGRRVGETAIGASSLPPPSAIVAFRVLPAAPGLPMRVPTAICHRIHPPTL